jgi:DNA repair protein RadC
MKTYKAETPEITLKYKASGISKTKITNSQDSYNLLKQMYDGDTLEYCESSIVIYLNRASNSIGWQKISQGGITGTVVDVRMILATALKCGSTSLILSHNHPSGNLFPSGNDDKLTKQIKNACDIMEIKLLDHLIITIDGYYSYADQGQI